MKTKQYPVAAFGTGDLDVNGHSLEDFLNPDLNLSVEGPDNGMDVLYFTLPGQVAAPGETDLLNMKDVVLKQDTYETFKEWAEHPFTHRKVMTGTVDENDIEQWYPVSIAPFDVRGKFDFIRCYILGWKENEIIKQFVRKFDQSMFPNLDLFKLSFIVHPQPGGLWGTRNTKHEDLVNFIPRALPDWHDDNNYEQSYYDYLSGGGDFAIRPFDLHYYLKEIEVLETKYRAFSVFQFLTEKRFNKEISEVKEILKNLDLGTVIIPYKGSNFYGEDKDTTGIF